MVVGDDLLQLEVDEVVRVERALLLLGDRRRVFAVEGVVGPGASQTSQGEVEGRIRRLLGSLGRGRREPTGSEARRLGLRKSAGLVLRFLAQLTRGRMAEVALRKVADMAGGSGREYAGTRGTANLGSHPAL